jgi:hypothetical protein
MSFPADLGAEVVIETDRYGKMGLVRAIDSVDRCTASGRGNSAVEIAAN